MRDGGRSWLRVIGGPAATSAPVLVVAVVGSGLLSLVGLPHASWERPAVRGLALLVAQLAMVAFLLLARVTVLRDAHLRPAPVRTVVVFSLAAFGMGYGYAASLEASGLAPAGSLTSDPPGWAMTMVLLIATVCVDAVRSHRARYRQLAVRRQRLATLRSEGPAHLERQAEATIRAVTEAVTAELNRLPELAPGAAVDRLRFTGHEVVRPRSHQLATEPVAIGPLPRQPLGLGLGWAQLARDATTPTAVAPLPLTAALLAVSVSFVTSQYGAPIAWAVLALMAGGGFLGARAAATLLAGPAAAWSGMARSLLLTSVFTATGAAIGGSVVALGWDPQPAATVTRSVLVAVTVGWAIALIGAGGIHSARTRDELAAAEAELEWEVARLNQLHRRRTRDLARVLHGPVQAAVNAAAIRLDAAHRAGRFTPGLLAEEQAQIVRALALLPDAARGRPANLRLALARVVATWAGISDIRLEVPEQVLDTLADDPACAGAVAELITEACANAALHARASRVMVRIALDPARRVMQVEVEDAGGEGGAVPASPGLGSQLLDDVTLAWDRVPTATGSSLRAALPAEPAAADLGKPVPAAARPEVDSSHALPRAASAAGRRR